MHGPNHGINVFMWTSACIVSAFAAFAIIKQYGEFPIELSLLRMYAEWVF